MKEDQQGILDQMSRLIDPNFDEVKISFGLGANASEEDLLKVRGLLENDEIEFIGTIV
jgi:hypothetical protein